MQSTVGGLLLRTRQEYRWDLCLCLRGLDHRGCAYTWLLNSTMQRSSRLLSMRGANALVCVPKGSGTIAAHSFLPSLLIGPLPSPPPNVAFHRRAAVGDSAAPLQAIPQPLTTPAAPPLVVRACVLTVSDRASRGEYKDETGPAVVAALQRGSSVSRG
eukprot:COSAG05_NODE_2807_length_2617_cov_2.139396_3_plen_158_part_00